MIPGPIGMVSAGLSAAAYARAGDKKQAAMMAATIALAAVGAGGAVKVYQAAKVAKAAKTARTTKSAFSLGKASKVTSGLAGRMFVGRGATRTTGGLMSKDGLRRCRPPTPKSSGRSVSNFETRLSKNVSKSKAWSYPNRTRNGHLTIKGWW